jgi:hypothetical protein
LGVTPNGDGSSTTHVVTVAATFQDLDGDVHELRSATLELPSQPSSLRSPISSNHLLINKIR